MDTKSTTQMVGLAAVSIVAVANVVICKKIVSIERKIDNVNENLGKKIDNMKNFLPGSTVDFWCPSMDKLKGPVGIRPNDQRQKVADYYGLVADSSQVAATDKAYRCVCCITKISGTDSGSDTINGHGAVVVSHNLGRKRPESAFHSFDLTIRDVDDMRNTIMMLKSIEQHYEKRDLCFVPTDNAKEHEFQVILMNPKLGKDPLFVYANGKRSEKTFADINKQPFSFPQGKVPFTRILSHHAQCCYAHGINEGWDVKQPPLFGSPLKNDTLHLDTKLLVSPPIRSKSFGGDKATVASDFHKWVNPPGRRDGEFTATTKDSSDESSSARALTFD